MHPRKHTPLLRNRLNGKHRSRLQNGFTLIELIVVLSITAILSMYAASQLAKESEETLAEGSGNYIRQVAAAAERHVLLNFNNYATNTAMTGEVTALLNPTVAELVTLKRLNGGFPSGVGSMPTRQTIKVFVTRSAGCPITNCTLTVLACTTTAIKLGGADVRYDLAQTMVNMQNGSGGQSRQGDGNNIRGPNLNTTNPVKLAGVGVEGIVCGSSVLDTELYNRFVTRQDTRDPDFKGPLTVAGATTLEGPTTISNNANVTGTFAVTGATTLTGATAINNNATVTGTLGVTGATTLTGATTINNNATVTGTLGVTGATTITGQLSANRLTPTGTYTAGTACAASEDGSIAKAGLITGLVACLNYGGTRKWVPLTTLATEDGGCTTNGEMVKSGATGVTLLCVNLKYKSMADLNKSGTPGNACTLEGTTAIDTASNNESLLCRADPSDPVLALKYMRMRDITQHLSFVESIEVINDQVIVKPKCLQAAGQTSTAVIQVIAKATSTKDGGTSVYATETLTAWKIRLTDGSGAPLTGSTNANAVAYIYCHFT